LHTSSSSSIIQSATCSLKGAETNGEVSGTSVNAILVSFLRDFRFYSRFFHGIPVCPKVMTSLVKPLVHSEGKGALMAGSRQILRTKLTQGNMLGYVVTRSASPCFYILPSGSMSSLTTSTHPSCACTDGYFNLTMDFRSWSVAVLFLTNC
jgi:hypothetical protein